MRSSHGHGMVFMALMALTCSSRRGPVRSYMALTWHSWPHKAFDEGGGGEEDNKIDEKWTISAVEEEKGDRKQLSRCPYRQTPASGVSPAQNNSM